MTGYEVGLAWMDLIALCDSYVKLKIASIDAIWQAIFNRENFCLCTTSGCLPPPTPIYSIDYCYVCSENHEQFIHSLELAHIARQTKLW